MTLGPATFCQLVFTSIPAALACFSIRPSRSISISGRNATPNCCAMVISDTSARLVAVPANSSAAAAIETNFMDASPSLFFQLEQLLRVGAADLQPVLFRQRRRVDPFDRVADVLERIVRRP